MNNEGKMREEFEAWYEGHCAPLESDWFKRDSDFLDDYDYFPAQEAWAGWQASRSALYVNLSGYVRDSLDGGFIYEEGAKAMLEEAGVNYK